MGEEVTLSAALREESGRVAGARSLTARRMRRLGFIPAVVYGHGLPTLALCVEAREFGKILQVVSSSTLVTLSVGADDLRRVLIQEVQRDPLTSEPLHIDFLEVQLTESIRVKVPLVPRGVSPAVKDLGGTLAQSLMELEVEALPQQLPQEITVDLSRLATFADRLTVADLIVPEVVTVHARASEIVAVVNPPRAEEELKELEGAPEEKAVEVKTEAEEKKAAASKVATDESSSG